MHNTTTQLFLGVLATVTLGVIITLYFGFDLQDFIKESIRNGIPKY